MQSVYRCKGVYKPSNLRIESIYFVKICNTKLLTAPAGITSKGICQAFEPRRVPIGTAVPRIQCIDTVVVLGYLCGPRQKLLVRILDLQEIFSLHASQWVSTRGASMHVHKLALMFRGKACPRPMQISRILSQGAQDWILLAPSSGHQSLSKPWSLEDLTAML